MENLYIPDFNDLKKKTHLGSGQFGDVYMVRDKKKTMYALKTIKKNKLDENPRLRKYIESEIMIMKQIKHPNIVELINS